jgi:membrane carboxypeptidase/penicillin-binding protein
MKQALKDVADVPFRIPPGIKLVKVNYETGKPSMAKNGTIYEAFKVGSEPRFVDSHAFSPEEIDENNESNEYLKEQYLQKKKSEEAEEDDQKKFNMKELY